MSSCCFVDIKVEVVFFAPLVEVCVASPEWSYCL